MKNQLIISLLIFSVGFSQKEYDINHVLEKKGVYIKKFSDEEVNGSVYQMFGDIKMDLGYIKNGKKEGLWTKWYDNGQKGIEGTYKDGLEFGLWTYFYENGQKQIEGIYTDWEKVGKWTYYNEDGSIKEVKEYPFPN